MAFVRYEDSAIKVGYTTATEAIFANNVTVTENLPLTAVRALGFNGAVATTSTGPIDGTFSITYVPTAGGSIGSACKTKDGVPETILFESPQKNYEDDPFVMTVADTQIFAKGAVTSFSVTVEPNAIVPATVEGNYYDCAGMLVGDAAFEGLAGTEAGGGDAVAHGSKSGPDDVAEVETVGFGSQPFTTTYSATRGLTPIFTVNRLDAVYVMPTDPTETLTMQGDNIPKPTLKGGGKADVVCDDSSYTPLCLDAYELGFKVNDVCGSNIYDVTVCGFMQSRDFAIAENDVLRGNVTIVDYNYKQDTGSE